MQPTANDFLTLVASTDISVAQGTIVSQYVAPVTLSTARPDGDVFHKVLYGQSLWSIAIAYNTTIDQIRALNYLGQDTTIYEGQLLLVQKAATQPGSVSPTVQETTTPSSTTTVQPPTPSVTAAILPSPTVTMEKPSPQGFSKSTVAGLFLALLVVGGLMVVVSAKKKG
jgi:spore germination protein YaaH